jgi:hypothetical protein
MAESALSGPGIPGGCWVWTIGPQARLHGHLARGPVTRLCGARERAHNHRPEGPGPPG